MATVGAFLLAEAGRILAQRPHVVLYGDQALLELGARRAMHLDQLVGPYSRGGFHHPGPAVFYVLAPFVRLLEPAGPGLYLGAAVLNAACLVAAVAVIWRRVGPLAALWAAAAIDLFCLCLGVGTLREPWNPYLIVAPMVLFVVLWAAGWTGSRDAAVWAFVIGSYLIQTEIATAAVVLVLCAGLAFLRLRRASPATPAHRAWALGPGWRDRRGPARRRLGPCRGGAVPGSAQQSAAPVGLFHGQPPWGGAGSSARGRRGRFDRPAVRQSRLRAGSAPQPDRGRGLCASCWWLGSWRLSSWGAAAGNP